MAEAAESEESRDEKEYFPADGRHSVRGSYPEPEKKVSALSIPAGLVRRRIRNPKEEPMKYLTFIRHPESYRESTPPPALMDAMGKFVEESLKNGTLVDTGGLLPSKDGARVRLSKGKITVTDGPFSESKEVIGGYAILNVATKAEALRIATEFMEMHRKYWPEFEGESELRPMFDPGMGP
jgi:hypothetical protein